MEFKPQFDQKSWDTIKMSVMWIFRAVAGADGNIDTKEQLALKNITENAIWIQNGFVREVIDDISINIGEVFRKSISDSRRFGEGMNDLLKILNKSGLDKSTIVGFKKALVAIGFYVANISGDDHDVSKNVSSEEAVVLKSLASTLVLSPVDLQQKPNIQNFMEIFAGKKKDSLI